MNPRMALFLALLVLPLFVSSERALTQTKSWVQPTVSMEVHKAGGQTDTYGGVPWSLGLTVLDVMEMVDGITFTGQWNRGLSDWLILSIDGIANNGAGKENWLYCVNGFSAGVGVGAYKLGPNSTIKWFYTSTYPPPC